MPNNQLIHEYIQHLEAMRKDSRERLHQSAIRWNEWANNRSAELSKHLFTIAALVLPLSLLPLTQQGFSDSIGIKGKISLLVSWIFFILSLVSGLVHLSKESNFFNNWAKQDNDRSAAFSEGIFTPSATDAFNRLKNMNVEADKLVKMSATSNPIFVYLQQIFLVIGIISIGSVLAVKLFSTSANSTKEQVSVNVNLYPKEKTKNDKMIRSMNYNKKDSPVSMTPTKSVIKPPEPIH